jgi:hypothetical protein
MKSASFKKMQAATSVNTGLVGVFRRSDCCIVAPVARLYKIAVIRTRMSSRVDR